MKEVTAYFEEYYDRLRLPVQTSKRKGLRRSQLGAVHAIGSHFTLRSDPAVITMPTGSGKTAVLVIAGYLLMSRRVLAVTPSRLVRGQVAQEFRSLAKLKEIGVLPRDCEAPSVFEVQKRIESAAQWDALLGYDVIVGTPLSVSPGIEAIASPPPDFFDLVLVDEAHHSPARVWNELLNAFPDAKRVLFTATPFRQDAKEIKGRFIYTYPVSEAFKDGIFGEISYLPVAVKDREDPDVAIARLAEQTLREDRAAGLDHALMVRTDSRKRADALATVYSKNTGLRLRTVHSGHTFRHIVNAINRLRAGELDGVICVDMMGEGFDFPELKVAAIHAPHKSLGVTLQFIGRFTRTAGASVGAAKFLAVPADIEIEAERLYDEKAAWQKIVPNLLQGKIQKEVDMRAALDTFEPVDTEGIEEAEVEDISLYGLSPYWHVKVLRVSGDVDLKRGLELGKLEIIRSEVSEDLQSVVAVGRTRERPEWTHLAELATVEHHLLIVHYHKQSHMLFICSSLREEWLYQAVAESVASGETTWLSPNLIYNALSGLTDFDFFNIGMRNRTLASSSESYRIMAGSSAQKAIRKSDGRLYHRGHTYGRARQGDELVTIGLSSASKIWSNRSSRLPELIAWCDELASRITKGKGAVTQSELDFLQTGVEASSVPEGPIAATWHSSAFSRPLRVFFPLENGVEAEVQLLDVELKIDRAKSSSERVWLVLQADELEVPVSFSLSRPLFKLVESTHGVVTVGQTNARQPLVQYLNSEPPELFFADGSSLVGNTLLEPPPEGFLPFDASKIDVVDWESNGVDVTAETKTKVEGRVSVQEFVERRLAAGTASVIIYDHGSGELADYIAIFRGDDRIKLELHHCKAAGGSAGGNRLEDVYEVCGQAIKSALLVGRRGILVDHVRRRLKRKGERPSQFVRGNLESLNAAVEEMRTLEPVFRIVVVQPGVSKSGLSPKMASVLGAVDDSVRNAGCQLSVLGSD
jgi:superfamily II DNA or RNA helicase